MMVKDKGKWVQEYPGRVDYNHMPTSDRGDNKNCDIRKQRYYTGYYRNSIRVPSLKRSKAVWRNFYKLFPHLKGKKQYLGYKLKKI